ncbi:MAG: hypothetical protein V1824_02910 [archaeon]
MQLNTKEEIYAKIKAESNYSDKELDKLLIDIKAKYHGLLSEVGANIMLAKELNINLDMKNSSAVLKISSLAPSLNTISMYARIKSIPPVKIFKGKDGKEGKVQVIYLYDDSGTTKLNLWRDQVDLIKQLNLEKNNLVLIKDAGVSEYNGKMELSLRAGGQIIINPKDSPDIAKSGELIVLSQIDKGYEGKSIDTIGRIINIYPLKEFESATSEKRSVLNFEISDGLKTLRCVAWQPWSEEMANNFTKGDLVRLGDVIVKDGLYDIEVHMNWASSIKKNPTDINISIPDLKDLIYSNYKEIKIEDLTDNTSCKLEGVIVSINKSNLRFFKCPKCKEKVHAMENEFICENCNEVVTPLINLFSSLDIDDSTGIIRLSFFNDLVEKLYNINKNDLVDFDEAKKEDLFNELEDKMLGKKVTVYGRAKLNSFSSKIEVLSDNILIE